MLNDKIITELNNGTLGIIKVRLVDLELWGELLEIKFNVIDEDKLTKNGWKCYVSEIGMNTSKPPLCYYLDCKFTNPVQCRNEAFVPSCNYTVRKRKEIKKYSDKKSLFRLMYVKFRINYKV